MDQQFLFKMESHPNRKHRAFHIQCQTFLKNIHYHNFKNGKHKEEKIGLYCPVCNKFYPKENVVVIQ